MAAIIVSAPLPAPIATVFWSGVMIRLHYR
jgi:hypothetical protein